MKNLEDFHKGKKDSPMVFEFYGYDPEQLAFAAEDFPDNWMFSFRRTMRREDFLDGTLFGFSFWKAQGVIFLELNVLISNTDFQSKYDSFQLMSRIVKRVEGFRGKCVDSSGKPVEFNDGSIPPEKREVSFVTFLWALDPEGHNLAQTWAKYYSLMDSFIKESMREIENNKNTLYN